MSYKELAAVVHAFVRRCPQLAPGESGRLYHYLRVSRSQPQQHMKQLSGRPPPALPPYVSASARFGSFLRLVEMMCFRDVCVADNTSLLQAPRQRPGPRFVGRQLCLASNVWRAFPLRSVRVKVYAAPLMSFIWSWGWCDVSF